MVDVENVLLIDRLGVGVPLLVMVQLIASPPLAVNEMGSEVIEATLVPTGLPLLHAIVFEYAVISDAEPPAMASFRL